jgi:hypothetical protein
MSISIDVTSTSPVTLAAHDEHQFAACATLLEGDQFAFESSQWLNSNRLHARTGLQMKFPSTFRSFAIFSDKSNHYTADTCEALSAAVQQPD